MVQLEDFSVYSFQEGSGLSGLKGFSGKVVSDSSSKLDHPLEIVETIRGNHMEMARFSDANDEGYRTVSKVIARCVTDIQQHEKRDKPTTGNTLDNVSPATKGKRYIRIPYISNNDFIGREKELLWLQAHLENQASNEEQHRVAVWGPGGAGKTQLVSTYAFRNQSKYSAIFWVTASSDITLRKTYADIAKYLDLALPSGGDQQTAIDSVRDWFTDHQQGDWLLVIDNADNLDEVEIHTVIPPINKGSVIITSRNRQAAGFGPAIEIGEMDAGDAVALLFRRAAIYHPAPMEEITGAEIAKSLGYLALAIEHAGAYVQSVGGTLHEYLQQFQDDRRDTLDKSPTFSMHKESVVQTFNMSFKAVMERNMAAAKLLCFMGFLDAEGVLESLILSTDERITIFRDEVMSGPKEFRDGIQVLTSFSLIRVKSEAEKKSISLHPLVHYLSRARLNVENQWRWKGRVTIWLVQLSVAANADTVYFPHVREQMQQMTEIKSSPADIQKRRSVYYCLALLMNHYRFAWQNLGAMDELHKYSEMVMEVVEEDLEDQEHLSIVAVMALIEVQIITVQFISSDSTYDQIVLRYVLKQMTPLAKKALENARDSQKKSNTSSNHASTAMSLPSEDDVKQDGLLSLHALTTALTQTVDAGSLVKVNLAQNDVQATQGSKAITSRDETSKHTPEVGDGLGQCEFLSIPSHDPVPTDQKPGNETLSQLESPVVNEQTTKKYEDNSLTSPSTTEPATDSLSFKPKHLSDVFLSVTPPIRVQCIQGSLGILIKVYHSHHRTAEADLLTTYSTLPVDSAEPADPLTLQISQLFIEASRLAAAQDLDGLLSIYPKIISIAPGSMEATYISLDYAIILNKLHRPAEADRVIRQILYSKPTTQSSEPMKLDQDLARDQPNAYVWLKKILSTSQRLQHHLDQSLQTLLITAQTAQAVFGTNSLSYYHTAFLLYRFYSCHHPQSHSNLECPREADKYWEISVSVLENLYCRGTSGGKQVCSVEGLHMGVMLWAQGALEETVGGFDAFAELSGRTMGENDALSRKARRAAAIAKEEWLLMKEEKKEDVLRFGTIVFPRKTEDLALLLED